MKKQLLKTKGLTASTKLEKWRRRLGARLKRQRERITEVQAALDYSMTHGWRTFEAIRDVLVQAGEQVMPMTRSCVSFSSSSTATLAMYDASQVLKALLHSLQEWHHDLQTPQLSTHIYLFSVDVVLLNYV